MKLPYAEGSGFLVPLPGGGWARGVVARMGPKGKVLLGYFFGPRLETPDAATLEGLEPNAAVLRIRFGDLGLIKGRWSVLGGVPDWDRKQWPMPLFVRRDPLGKLKPRAIEYSDSDPNLQVGEHVVEEDKGLQTDAMSGYASVEMKLDHLLK